MKTFRIFLLTIILLLFLPFSNGHRASASSFTEEFSSLYIINKDLSTYVTFREVFTNNSETEVLDSYEVVIPFADAKDVNIKVNGAGLVSGQKVSGGRTEVNVEFDPIVKNQTAVVLTSFTTHQVAENFGGISTVLLPAVALGVNVKNQTVNVPKALGSLSSTSADLTISSNVEQNIYSFNSSSNVYMTFGEIYKFNFNLRQSLTNNTDKKLTTRFLLPYDDSSQGLYCYPSDSDVTLLVDESYNKEVFVSLGAGESKNLELSGALNAQYKLKEPVDSKVNEIYSQVISEHSPSSVAKFERKPLTELKGQQSLEEIQYADLLVSLLEEYGIDARVVVGRNNGAQMFGSEDNFNIWVSYYDKASQSWSGLDPYFADFNGLGDKPFFNPDRISYFVSDGNEDLDSFNYYFLQGQGSFIQLAKYEGDEILINKAFDYELFPDPVGEISLDVYFPLSVKLVNNSSRAMRVKNIYYKDDELKIKRESKDVWSLPGQSVKYQVEGLMVKGLFGEKKQMFDLSFNIESAGRNTLRYDRSVEVTALPTIRTFLPMIIVVAVLAIVLFLFPRLRKRIKLTHKR